MAIIVIIAVVAGSSNIIIAGSNSTYRISDILTMAICVNREK